MRRIFVILFAIAIAFSFEVEYLHESSGQRRDGSQLFDISYRISDAETSDTVHISMMAITASGDTLPMNTFIAGSDTGLIIGSGEYSAIWNIGADVPDREFYTDSIDIMIIATEPGIDVGDCLGPYCAIIGLMYDDYSNAIIQNTDGDYVITGKSDISSGIGVRTFISLIKITEGREIIWFKHFPLVEAEALDIKQTADNGYAICGKTLANNIIVLKANEAGDLEWYITLSGSSTDAALSIVETPDNDLLITGYTNSYGTGGYDGCLIKLRNDGVLLWAKTYGSAANDIFRDGMYSSAGDIIVGGSTQSAGAGEYDCLALSVDTDGNLNWASVCGTSRTDEFYSVTEAMGNSFVFAGGYVPGSTSETDMIVGKFSGAGIFQWCYGGGDSNYDELYSIITQSDNNFATCGYTRSYGAGTNDYIGLRISVTGSIMESHTYGGSDREEAMDIIETTDNNYILSGRSLSFADSVGNENLIVKTFDDLSSCCSEEITLRFLDLGMTSASATSAITVSDFTPALVWNTGYFIANEAELDIVCP